MNNNFLHKWGDLVRIFMNDEVSEWVIKFYAFLEQRTARSI